jgi:hypothetical protein
MTHDSFRELIQRELDGDLTAEEIEHLEAHTASCEDCRRERDDYRRLAAAFGNLSKVMPEKSFVPLMEPELPQVLRKKKRRLPTFFWPVLTGAAALALTVGLYRNSLPPMNPSPSVGENESMQVLQVQPKTDEQTKAKAPVASKDREMQQPEPKLITEGKVKEKPPVQVAAVTKNELGKVQNQTGIKVETRKVEAVQVTPEPTQNGVVVVTVDSQPTDVKVDGDNVTVIVAQDRPQADGEGSDVRVYGIAGLVQPGDSGQKTITFIDPEGNVISTAQVDLLPVPGPLNPDSELNRRIADDYKADPKGNAWAEDPYQVVVKNLSGLGFSETATVSQSNELDHVTVTQDGATYQIQLKQAAQGFWQPVQIARLILPHESDPAEKKVIAYFAGLKAKGELSDFGDLYLMERTDDAIKVSAFVERRDSSGSIQVNRKVFEFQIIETLNGDIQLGDQVTVTTIN